MIAPVNASLHSSESPKPSLFMGVLVTLAGIIGGGAGTALFLVPGFVAVVVVAVGWGIVYARAPRAQERWPWWVAGQWLSLVLVNGMSTALHYGTSYVVLASLASATLATILWMVPVGLVVGHRAFWATKRTDIPPPHASVEPELTP